MSVLALPMTAFRVTRQIAGKLTLPALAGAAAVVYRTMRHPSAPAARVTPDPRPQAAPASRPKPAATPVPEPKLVVDPVPLAEPAVDLDVEVTLPSELPIRAYDALSAKDATTVIRDLTDAEEVRTIITFEEENAKRSTVLTAARARLAVLESGAATVPGTAS